MADLRSARTDVSPLPPPTKPSQANTEGSACGCEADEFELYQFVSVDRVGELAQHAVRANDSNAESTKRVLKHVLDATHWNAFLIRQLLERNPSGPQ